MAGVTISSSDSRLKPWSWHFITGEYPPQPGGVSDYCSQVATSLAAEGEDVHVWAPPSQSEQPAESPVQIHRLRDRFGRGSLAELGRGIGSYPQPRCLFVQYVAGAFGWRSMNLPFCLWLSRNREDTVWVMFHEYAYPLRWGLKPGHALLGIVTSIMGSLVAGRADRLFVSTPAWEARMSLSIRRKKSITWLPVPSNLPLAAGDDRAGRVRRLSLGDDAVLVGHFGTYGPGVASILLEVLPELLARDPRRHVLLMGRNSSEFLDRLIGRHPEHRGRLVATGSLAAADMTGTLRGCDVLLQPYPDGVTSRRSSIMAGLSLGLPIITNAGELTERIWSGTDAVVMAPSVNPAEIISAAEKLLSAPSLWSEIGRKAAALYSAEFSLDRTLEIIRAAAREEIGLTGA